MKDLVVFFKKDKFNLLILILAIIIFILGIIAVNIWVALK